MAKNTQTNPSAPSAPKSLDALRDDLDQFDQRILQLINERAAVAQTIGEAKRAAGDQIYDPRREAEVIERAVLRNDGPLGDHSVQAVFREIVSGARAIQAPMRVAYLGPEFTFSHLAAIQQFGDSADLAAVTTIASVFEEVERGQADYGVVPMENSTDGRVSDTLECFARSTLRICAELPVGIHHCLMGVGSQDEIEIVHSKPQALSQCRNWLAQHLPNAVVRPVGSTAEAAVYARANPKMAAVGSERLGANYDLKVFARNIEDNAHNETRFAVIGTESAEPTGNDKTSIMFEIAHEPGALADTMAIFKDNQLNMTWIESFPIPGSRGRYLFFVEFEGHQQNPPCDVAIKAVKEKSLRLEVLGSYAQAPAIG